MNLLFIIFPVYFVFYWLASVYYCAVRRQESKYTPALIKRVLINQVGWTWVWLVPFHFYPEPYSSWWNIVWQLPAIIVLTDTIFFFSHRYFHRNKWLYTNVHALHHSMDDPPMGLGAFNVHPVEYIFLNLLSTGAPLFIVKANVFVCMVWTMIAAANIVVCHAGDCEHREHHRNQRCNYGTWPYVWDGLFGLYKEPVHRA